MIYDFENYEDYKGMYLCDILEEVVTDNSNSKVNIFATYRYTYCKFQVLLDCEMNIISTVPSIKFENEITLTLEDIYNIDAETLVSLDNEFEVNVLYSTVYTDENTVTSNSDELLYYVSQIEVLNYEY